MDPRAVSSPLQVFSNVAAETVVYLANLLLYYKVLMYSSSALENVEMVS